MTPEQMDAIKAKIRENLGVAPGGALPSDQPTVPVVPMPQPRPPQGLSTQFTGPTPPPSDTPTPAQGDPSAMPGTLPAPEDATAAPIDHAAIGQRLVQPSNVRTLLSGGGAAIGAIGGGAVGGPLGAVGGTVGGSLAGHYLANVIDDLRGVVDPDTGLPPTNYEKLVGPMQNALQDGALSGAVFVAPFALKGSKMFLAHLLKIPPNSKEAFEEAASIGVSIGVGNVVQGGPVHAFLNAGGRMPIIGGSAKQAARESARELVHAKNQIFGQVANPRSTSEWTREGFIRGSIDFDNWANSFHVRQTRAFQAAENAPPVHNTAELKESTRNALNRISNYPGGGSASVPRDVRAYLETLENLPDKINPMDLYAIKMRLTPVLASGHRQKDAIFSPLEEITDTVNSLLRRSTNRAAKGLMITDDMYERGMEKYLSPIGQTFGQVERNVFTSGKAVRTIPGTRNIEEFLGLVEKHAHTPQGVRNLRELTGDTMVHNMLRQRLDDAYEAATKGTQPGPFNLGQPRMKFEGEAFNKELGLLSPNSAKYKATQEMLRGTDVTIDDLTKFVRVATNVGSAPLHDASTFIARATALRAAGGIVPAMKKLVTGGFSVGSAAGTAAGATGIISTGAGIPFGGIALGLTARWGMGKMMQPGLLRSLTDMADTSVDTSTKRAAFLQVLTNYPTLFEDSE